MSYTATGKIHSVSGTITRGKYQSRELVLAIQENTAYPPDLVKFETGKPEKFDGLKEGETVEVSFNLRGREWQNPKGELVYFNSLSVWKVDRINVADELPPVKTAADMGTRGADMDPDDLPF